MRKMLQRYRIYYFFLAVVSIIGAVAIVQLAQSGTLLRGYGPDILFVFFLYAMLSSIMLNWPPEDKTMIILILSILFEGLQFALSNSPSINLVVELFSGATFDWIDMIVVAVMSILCALLDYAFVSKKQTSK